MKRYCRALVLTVGRDDKKPWWRDFISFDQTRCQLHHRKIVLKSGGVSGIFSLRFAALVFQVLSVLARARNRYDNILTLECGWESLVVALFQTLVGSRTPRHVIVQFIMREKTQSLRSRIKYAFMRWCFSSVYLFVCSSRAEARYYQSVFGWPSSKTSYVPLLTDPRLLEHESAKSEGFILSAGRTFRDYGTLLAVSRRVDAPFAIVASPSSLDPNDIPPNVKIYYDIPGHGLIDLMARSLAVVLPLENRMISIGQSVLLQGMALGKAVIATRVNGTEDYIEHMKTGILVPPNDPTAMEAAITTLIGDEELRLRLGCAARDRVRQMHLPQHYANEIQELLSQAH